MNIASLLRKAYVLAAEMSTDKSSQNGAILVNTVGIEISVGWNSFCLGTKNLPERHERPAKYAFTEHAERRAIFAAVRDCQMIPGSTLICPWLACADCARAIIECGITNVICHKARMELTDSKWRDPLIHKWDTSVSYGIVMLNEANIGFTLYSGPLESCPEILVDGKLWKPQ